MKKRDAVRFHNALKDIQQLRNALTDLVPALPFATEQISNMETLFANNRYTPLTINRLLLAYLYCEHGIIQTAIEQPVQDAFRGGLDIESTELDADNIKQFQDYLEEKDVLGTIQEALIWKRLFGGAGIIINAAQDPANPFTAEEFTDLEFYAADRWELNAPNRKADSYTFYSVKIDASRVITLTGKKAPSFVRPQLNGWGMSEIEHMVRDLNAYFKNKNLGFELMDEAKIDVYGIAGFNKALLTSSGTNIIQRRIQLANEVKNYQRAVVMDKEDTYDQKQLNLSNTADMTKECRIGIASALRMPITKLFGISAAGFNSGEDDIENYNSMVESDVRTPARPVIRKILGLCMYKLFGFEPDFHFDFKPLRIMGEKEEEEIKTSQQNRVVTLYSLGLLTPEEVGNALSQYKLLPMKTALEQGLLTDPTPPGQQNAPQGDGQGPTDSKPGTKDDNGEDAPPATI